MWYSTRFRYQKISARGVQRDAGPPNINLGSPNVSETTEARKLKLKLHLDVVKY